MMKEYIFNIIAASIICGIINSIGSKASVVWTIIKSLSRILLIITIMTPLINLDFSSITQFTDDYSVEVNTIIEQGEAQMNASLRTSIKEQTEAYILNKAAILDADLIVEVTLSNENPPIPVSVVLCGRVSPYAKSKLSQLISDDLGIPKENQKWE